MTERPCLLIVSDSQGFQLRIAAALSDDYRLAGSAFRGKALNLAQENPPDLILLRLRPLTEALQTIRQADPATPLLASGSPNAISLVVESFKGLNLSFLKEPFSELELRWAVHDALEKRSLLRDSRRLKALLPLFEMSKTMISEVDLDKLLQGILEIVRAEAEAERVSLMLLDETTQELTVKAALGLPQDLLNAKRLVGEGIAGWVAMTAQPLLLPQPVGQGSHRRAMGAFFPVELQKVGFRFGRFRTHDQFFPNRSLAIILLMICAEPS